MKKILFITYFFPPVGGGGVIRNSKYVKYLPEFGWQPFVVTSKKAFYPLEDKELLNEIPKDIEISKVGYLEPGFWFNNHYWRSFLRYFLYPIFLIPDAQILWFLPAYLKARKLIQQENIKIIYTSSAPSTDHLIGWALKKTTKVGWVADFRDEWSNNPLRKYPTVLHKWLNQILEKRVVKNADKVISVSEPITKYLAEIEPKKGKYFTLTNGFDGEDFKNFSLKNNQTFTIVYSGAIYNSKIIKPFLAAIEELKLPDIKVVYIGQEKRVTHKKAVEGLAEASILLLVLDPVDRPAVMTGKIYEYLAAKKPILALAPKNSAVAKLINQLKVGKVVPTLDKEKIKEAVLFFYKNRNRLKTPNIDLAIYDRKNITKNLVGIFENLKDSWLRRICLIGNIESPQNQDLLKFLLEKKLELYFISTTAGTFSGVKVYILNKSKSTFVYFFKSSWRIKNILRKINPDLLHCQDLVFAGIWGNLTGYKPLVLTAWGSDLNNYKKFVSPEKYLIKEALINADLLTAPSLALGQVAQKIGLKKEKFQLIHFGVDLNIFKKYPVRDLKNKYGSRKKIIFCPRSIAPIYNTDILIEAFRILNRKKEYKLILLEQNTQENYLVEIEKLIIKYDLLSDIIFLDKLSPKEMADYYNLADVVVSVASSDGCARSFLEALATEKKIVITNLAFTNEWFEKNNFWRVKVRDVQDTAKAIKKALNYDQIRFSKTGEQNRQLVLKKAEIKTNFEKLHQLYRQLK